MRMSMRLIYTREGCFGRFRTARASRLCCRLPRATALVRARKKTPAGVDASAGVMGLESWGEIHPIAFRVARARRLII